jgi:hypothetical protein
LRELTANRDASDAVVDQIMLKCHDQEERVLTLREQETGTLLAADSMEELRTKVRATLLRAVSELRAMGQDGAKPRS